MKAWLKRNWDVTLTIAFISLMGYLFCGTVGVALAIGGFIVGWTSVAE